MCMANMFLCYDPRVRQVAGISGERGEYSSRDECNSLNCLFILEIKLVKNISKRYASLAHSCSSSRTETSEILKYYSHFNIGSHSSYVCFCFLYYLCKSCFNKTTMSNKRYRAYYTI